MTITIEPEDPRSPEAQGLLSAFIEEVRKRYDEPPADVGYFDPDLVSVPRSTFLVVRLEGKAVGCGALVPIEDEVAEIKRMFVVPGERGRGIAPCLNASQLQAGVAPHVRANSDGAQVARLRMDRTRNEKVARTGA